MDEYAISVPNHKQMDLNGYTFLIIKPGAIGDVLHMTPVVRAVKRHLPASKILFLVGSKATSDLLSHNPHINEVILFQKGKGIKEFFRILSFGSMLKTRGIQILLNYQPSNWRWRLLTLILNPQKSISYKKQKRIKGDEKTRHAVEDHLNTLQRLGIVYHETCLDFFLTDQEKQKAGAIFQDAIKRKAYRGIICLNIGASHPVNRWPVEAFHKLNDLLTSRGFRTILIGGPEDRELANQFFSHGPTQALDLVGRLPIRETAAVLSRSHLMVSGDTGPLHLATSVGTKVIGIFGAADPNRTGPIGDQNIIIQSQLHCVPCRKRYCPNGKRSCMESVKPEDVFARIDESVKWLDS